ncbi:MAG: hypothetical protein A2Y24_08950 [Clostridiales bacterium GWE2_32_10]|nr:MAG: hypothetical protein A2Y24_08950 [Clostridiales bacterium GWE2_32_10]HBY20109.1 DNA polymerase IV [Clostridiales bacterium]
MRQILHIDINSFFASCEQVVDKNMRGKPIAVVSSIEGRNAILLAVSYEAKACGIKRTMSIREAKNLCPGLNLKVANHQLYQEFSKKFVDILCEYAPIVENTSIDEAYLDMSGTERLYGDIKDFAKKLQGIILNQLLLPTSIGISDNKLLAKMASDYKKPMGITELYGKNIKKLMWALSVDNLIGVGEKTLEILKRLGIYTIGELAVFDETQLKMYFGDKTTHMLHNFANGIDNSQVLHYDIDSAKSVGSEITFEKDVILEDIIKKQLLIIAEKVASRLRKINKRARTVTLKIKYNNFTVVTRSHTLDKTFNTTDTIYKTAVNLYKEHCIKTIPIRLIGIQLSGICEACAEQLSLFSIQSDIKNEKVEKTIDEIRRKYGYNSIRRGR